MSMIIPPGFNLPNAIRVRLGQNTFGRQRLIFEDGHLLLVLHRPPEADDRQREGVLFWRNPEGVWKWTRGANGAPALVAHVQAYAEREAFLTSAADKADNTETLYNLQAAITPLARSARNMHNTLQAARDAIKSEKLLIDLRDRAYEIERNLELLLEDVRNTIQYRTVREAEEQSRLTAETLRASHRLNTLAAWFLPLTALTGIFGMDLTRNLDIPTAAWCAAIIAMGTTIGFALKSWVLADGPTGKRPEGKTLK
jgi:hypothetical protein